MINLGLPPIKVLPSRTQETYFEFKDEILYTFIDIGTLSPVDASKLCQSLQKEMDKKADPYLFVPIRENHRAAKYIADPGGIHAERFGAYTVVWINIGDNPPMAAMELVKKAKAEFERLRSL